MTLKDPNCAFQLMKKHFARYTPEKVNEITGAPVDTFLQICQTYAATGQPGKAGTILYAMGTTQHTYGAQNIRSYCLLQLLLGNIGIAGAAASIYKRGELPRVLQLFRLPDQCVYFAKDIPGILLFFRSWLLLTVPSVSISPCNKAVL